MTTIRMAAILKFSNTIETLELQRLAQNIMVRSFLTLLVTQFKENIPHQSTRMYLKLKFKFKIAIFGKNTI